MKPESVSLFIGAPPDTINMRDVVDVYHEVRDTLHNLAILDQGQSEPHHLTGGFKQMEAVLEHLIINTGCSLDGADEIITLIADDDAHTKGPYLEIRGTRYRIERETKQ